MAENELKNRWTAPEYAEKDAEIEVSLRPKTLSEYIGQDKAKENLSIYMEAAKMRGEPLDHCLIYGPPGLGKTTLAGIISRLQAQLRRSQQGGRQQSPEHLLYLRRDQEGSPHLGQRHGYQS
ncbi:MAG: hypothetical protein IIW83_04710, partial [Clostridia bacterium]|nr:hypothetical protein [Clostridia bacterium]